MGAKAVELLLEGRSNRLVAYKDGQFTDFDIQDALAMSKELPKDQFRICKLLVR